MQAELRQQRDGSALALTLRGDWQLGQALPDADELLRGLEGADVPSRITYECNELGDWDSSLLTLLSRIYRQADSAGIENDLTGLPEGARGLLKLAFTVAEREGARRKEDDKGVMHDTGEAILDSLAELRELVTFTGRLILSCGRLMRGEATVRGRDLWLAIQEAGAEALPIVGLISLLIGMIFAFVGVVQLTNFGAGIYTADLVAVALVREMAPIMTAILMAGRTGAAYAAEIGTMKVNEEIDALTTLGINEIDYLVLPRFFALILIMPFLTMYASVLGIAGGTLVGMAMLDVTLVQYVAQTNSALTMNNLLGGLFKAVVYGAMVALTGTQQGIACGSSAMAVGQSTTRAVVLGIVLIVVSAALLTIIYINIGI